MNPPPGGPEAMAGPDDPMSPMNKSPLVLGVMAGARAGVLPEWSNAPGGAWSSPPIPDHSETFSA